jgi:hypothetical protein
MALGAMAGPPRGSGRLDQGLSAQPSFPEPSEPLRHQPVRPGSMRLREYVLVLETVPGLSHQPTVGRDAASMVHQERLSPDQGRDRNPEIVFIKTWEDLLSGHPIWFSGTILQLVLGKGLVYQEV